MVSVLTYLAVYMVPTFMLFFMAGDVLLRNPRRREYQLFSLYLALYGLLFLEEYVRHQVSITYSESLVNYWFACAGLAIPAVLFHFVARVTGFQRRLPQRFFPYAFYITLIPVLITWVTQTNFMNSREFVQVGMWYYPILNDAYYKTTFGANGLLLVMIIILWKMRQRTQLPERKRVVSYLLVVGGFVFIWDLAFGLYPFQGVIPPYAYIFGSLIWAVALRYAMLKFDFLESPYKRFETLYRLNPSAIVLVNRHGHLMDANPAAKTLLNMPYVRYQQFHQLIGDSRRTEWLEQFHHHVREGVKLVNFETKLKINEEERYVIIEGDQVFIDEERLTLLIIRDIHEAKEADKLVRFLAYHDSLTRLANRRYFYDSLQRKMDDNERVAVVIIDLDGFKQINDTYGHQMGDAFLIHFAHLLRQHVGHQGMAARIGGDEFYLYRNYETREEMEQFIGELRAIWQAMPFVLGDVHIPLRASVGLSLYPPDGRTIDELVHIADEAMYQSKKAQR